MSIPTKASPNGSIRRWRFAVTLLFILSAATLCFYGVIWTYHQPTFLYMDEIGNLVHIDNWSWIDILHLPSALYNDRPAGFLFERLLYRWFGFSYVLQITVYLVLHFLNCILIGILFRHFGLPILLSAPAVGLFGVLTTTIQTATYIGAVFDILSTLLLLSSMIMIFGRRRWQHYMSAVLFLLALRTKEFIIVAPLLMALLLVWLARERSMPEQINLVTSKLWLHFVILAAFGTAFLRLYLRQPIPAGNPYHLDFHPLAVLQSVLYYVSLACSRPEVRLWPSLAIVSILAVHGLLRWSAGTLVALGAFLLTIAPVAVLPARRFPYYDCCPQIFLLLGLCLFIEDLIKLTFKNVASRLFVTCLAGMALLCYAFSVRTSSYFRNIVHFNQSVRKESAISAAELDVKLAEIGRGSHFYFNGDRPWLMIPGPCGYLRIRYRDESVSCEIQKCYPDLVRDYEDDPAEKYLLNYRDGHIDLVDAERAQ
jgi:hypothetical protein